MKRFLFRISRSTLCLSTLCLFIGSGGDYEKKIAALIMTIMLALVAATIAFADVSVEDGDVVVSGVQGTVNLGVVAPGAVLHPNVSFLLVHL